LEELLERNGLEIALANRSEDELAVLLEFLIWKLGDHRYGGLLVQVARVTVDMYAAIWGISGRIDGLFGQLR